MNWRGMTIGKKISLGFGLVLLLTVILVGIYQFALSSTTSTFTELLEVEMTIAVRANTALNHLNLCRRFEKNFVFRGTTEEIKNQKNSFADLQDELDTIEALAKKADKTKVVEQIGKAHAQAEIYQKTFELTVAAPESERQSFDSKLRDTARGTESLLKDLCKSAQDEANQDTVIAKSRVRFSAGWPWFWALLPL